MLLHLVFHLSLYGSLFTSETPQAYATENHYRSSNAITGGLSTIPSLSGHPAMTNFNPSLVDTPIQQTSRALIGDRSLKTPATAPAMIWDPRNSKLNPSMNQFSRNGIQHQLSYQQQRMTTPMSLSNLPLSATRLSDDSMSYITPVVSSVEAPGSWPPVSSITVVPAIVPASSPVVSFGTPGQVFMSRTGDWGCL